MLITRKQLQQYLQKIIKESLINTKNLPIQIVKDENNKSLIYIHSKKVLEEFNRLLILGGKDYGVYFEDICYSTLPLYNKNFFKTMKDLNENDNQAFADAVVTQGDGKNILYSIKFSEKLAQDRLTGIKYSLINKCMLQALSVKGIEADKSYHPGFIKGSIDTKEYFGNDFYKQSGCLPLKIRFVRPMEEAPKYSIDSNGLLKIEIKNNTPSIAKEEIELADKIMGTGNYDSSHSTESKRNKKQKQRNKTTKIFTFKENGGDASTTEITSEASFVKNLFLGKGLTAKDVNVLLTPYDTDDLYYEQLNSYNSDPINFKPLSKENAINTRDFFIKMSEKESRGKNPNSAPTNITSIRTAFTLYFQSQQDQKTSTISRTFPKGIYIQQANDKTFVNNGTTNKQVKPVDRADAIIAIGTAIINKLKSEISVTLDTVSSLGNKDNLKVNNLIATILSLYQDSIVKGVTGDTSNQNLLKAQVKAKQDELTVLLNINKNRRRKKLSPEEATLVSNIEKLKEDKDIKTAILSDFDPDSLPADFTDKIMLDIINQDSPDAEKKEDEPIEPNPEESVLAPEDDLSIKSMIDTGLLLSDYFDIALTCIQFNPAFVINNMQQLINSMNINENKLYQKILLELLKYSKK